MNKKLKKLISHGSLHCESIDEIYSLLKYIRKNKFDLLEDIDYSEKTLIVTYEKTIRI